MNFYNKLKLNIKALKNILWKEKESLRALETSKNKNYIIFKNVEICESSIGDYSYVSKNSILHNCEVGKFCSIGPNVIIGYGEHPYHFLSTSPLFYAAKDGMFGENLFTENDFEHHEKVTIGNDVWIGANVYIKNGISIGDGAVIGAGAVVTKSVPPYAIVIGIPAKIVKYRFSEEQINKLLNLKWWNWSIEKLKENKNIFTTEDFSEIL